GTDEVRVGDQPQDRQRPRPHDPALAAGAGGPSHRMIDRRGFLPTPLGGALASRLAAGAQRVARVPRIGWLRLGRPGSSPWEVDGFREGLRELGYVEGQSLVVEYRYADHQTDRL